LFQKAFSEVSTMEVTPHHLPVTVHLRDYLRVLWRRKWILVICVVVLESTVAIGTFLQTPVYRATAKVLIEREVPKVMSFQEVSPIDTTSQDYYQTQYEIIRSRPIIEKVLDRLGLLQSHPALANARDPVSAFLTRVSIEPIRNSRLVGITVEDEDAKLAAEIANLIAALYVEETINTRLEAARQALGWLSDQLVDLKAKAQESDTALQRYKEEAGLLAVEEKQDITVKKLEEFNSEYIAAKAKRLELESQLVELKRALGDRDKLSAAPVVVQNPLIQKLRTDLVTLQVKVSELEPQLTEKHPEVLKLRSQIDKITHEIDAEVSRLVRSTETEYNALKAREQAMLAAVGQYRDEVQGLANKQIQYGVLKREADTNQEMYNLLLKRMKETSLEGGLPSTNVRVVEEALPPRAPFKPNRPLNLALGLVVSAFLGLGLVFFAEYMDDTIRTAREIEELTGLTVVGVIPAVASRAAVAAHALAVGLAWTQFAPPVDGPSTASPALIWLPIILIAVPLFVAIFAIRRRRLQPHVAAVAAAADNSSAVNATASTLATPLMLCNGTPTPATEAFRSMRTQLIVMMRQRKLRHLVITSTGPGEGKSTIAANLALVTARAGYRVLLVDADMHRPQLHTIFSIANDRGFTDILHNPEGHTVDPTFVSRFCHATAVPQLTVLTAGAQPDAAAELFAEATLRAAVAAFGAEFDLIIYDSPPVLSVADPTVLAALADGVLLVVRAGRYPRDAIQQAYAALAAVDAKLIGAVLNAVDVGAGSEYSGYHGYYRYAYPEP
jgi:capsular exopolysaccharide synthesis family protein